MSLKMHESQRDTAHKKYKTENALHARVYMQKFVNMKKLFTTKTTCSSFLLYR